MTMIAVCQIDIVNGNLEVNLDRVIDDLHVAGSEGAELAVFPELCLSGYRFELISEVKKIAIAHDHPVLSTITECCLNYGMAAVVGFIEKSGKRYFNTAAVLGAAKEPLLYRKIHLPEFGVDQFVETGNLGFPVFELPSMRLGINICYDQRFPESARVLSTQGAEVIVVPTSEPLAEHPMLEILTRARAYENRVFYILANRVGSEFGTKYKGASRIIDTMGNVIGLAATDQEEILFAEIEPSLAQNKRVVMEQATCEMDLFADRMPENYRSLCR